MLNNNNTSDTHNNVAQLQDLLEYYQASKIEQALAHTLIEYQSLLLSRQKTVDDKICDEDMQAINILKDLREAFKVTPQTTH